MRQPPPAREAWGAARGSNEKPWVVGPRRKPTAELRLFCLPYAGGGATIYQRWQGSFPDWIDVCPVQLPGREGRLREAPLRRLPVLLERIGEGLSEWLDRPYALFGHSMGGLVVSELAHYLRERHGRGPDHVFVSGRAAPQLAPRAPPIYALPDEEFLSHVRSWNGIPESVWSNKELMDLVLPALRADIELCETYAYQARPPLDCAMTVLGGLRDEDAPVDQLDAWRSLCAGKFSVQVLPGDHFFIHSASEQVKAVVLDGVASGRLVRERQQGRAG